MKQIIFFISICFCYALFNFNCFAKTNESLDQIEAIVNEEVITTTELNRQLAIVKLQITNDHLSVPSYDVLKKQVLDQLINKMLQLQIAKQANITVSEDDVDETISSIAKHNQMSVDDLYTHVKQDGLSKNDYRDAMREQMTLQKLQRQEIVNRISVSPDEIDNFLRSQPWKKNLSREYHLEDILIPLPEAPSSDQISNTKKHANVVMTKLKENKDFHAIAQAESGDKNALEGGDLGFRKLPEIPSAFAEYIVNMKVNDIAGPIQTPNGFHIIRLAGLRDGEAPVTDKPNRKQIENLLLQRKFEEAVQNWLSKLRSQAFIVTETQKA